MTPFGEILKTIIDGIDVSSVVYDGENLTKVNYQYGHPLEIVNTLIEMTKNSDYEGEKFPLVAAFMDVSEDVFRETTINSLKIIIATDTMPNFKASDRTQETFEPILIPLYDLIVKKLKRSPELWWEGEHTRTLRYYWGKQGLYGSSANVFNDHVDAIELDLKNLILIDNC